MDNKELLIGGGIFVALIVFFVFHNFLSPIKTGKITLVPQGSQAALNPGLGGGYGGYGGYGIAGQSQNQAYQNSNSGIIANQQMSGTNAYDVALAQQRQIANAFGRIGGAIQDAYSGDDEDIYQ